MSSIAGLKQIGLCNLATLNTTPAGIVKIGLRNKASMQVTGFKQITDYRNRKLPNLDNVKIEAESFQPTMYMLKQLISFLNGNADVQVLTNSQSASADSEDVYQFVGDNVLGLDFTLEVSDAKRSLIVSLERAFATDVWDAILADTGNGAVALGADNVEGVNFDYYRKPYYLTLASPSDAGVNFASEIDIVSRKLIIKTVGKKTSVNTSFVDKLNVSFELVIADAAVSKYQAARALGISPSLLLQESNGGANFDAFSFAANKLVLNTELSNDDDNRNLKLVYEADIPLFDAAVTVGTTQAGDAVGGTGLLGGTLAVS